MVQWKEGIIANISWQWGRGESEEGLKCQAKKKKSKLYPRESNFWLRVAESGILEKLIKNLHQKLIQKEG